MTWSCLEGENLILKMLLFHVAKDGFGRLSAGEVDGGEQHCNAIVGRHVGRPSSGDDVVLYPPTCRALWLAGGRGLWSGFEALPAFCEAGGIVAVSRGRGLEALDLGEACARR